VLVHERAYRKNIKLRARDFFFLQIWLPPKGYEPQFNLPSRNSLVGSQILYTQMRDHQDLLFALQRNSQMNVQSCPWPPGNHATSSQLHWLKIRRSADGYRSGISEICSRILELSGSNHTACCIAAYAAARHLPRRSSQRSRRPTCQECRSARAACGPQTRE